MEVGLQVLPFPQSLEDRFGGPLQGELLSNLRLYCNCCWFDEGLASQELLEREAFEAFFGKLFLGGDLDCLQRSVLEIELLAGNCALSFVFQRFFQEAFNQVGDLKFFAL